MKNFYLTIALVLGLFLQLNAALITWTGGGAANDFNDPANWDLGVVPGAADDVVITGSSVAVVLSTPFTAASLEIKSGASVTVGATGVLNLGNDTGSSTNGALDLNSASATFINDGVINVTNAAENGIDSRGTFINNGAITISGFDDDGIRLDDASITPSTFTNNGTIDIIMNTGGEDDGLYVNDGSNFINSVGSLTISSVGCVGDAGIHIDNGGILTNQAPALVTVANTIQEAIFIDVASTVNNSGAISTANTGQCSGSGNHGIEVRGTFNNNAGGSYKDANARGDAIRIEDVGVLNNAGTLILDITSGSTSDAIENQNVFVGAAGSAIEIGCAGVINEIEVNGGPLDLGASCVTFNVNGTGSGGADFDRFEIKNTVLTVGAATAKLSFDNGFVPVPGDCFRIVAGNSDGSGTVAGEFAAITSNIPGLCFEPEYIGTDVTVCVIEKALAVDLISFRGTKSERGATLSWETSSETNNAGFEIERSADARNWTKLAYVVGNGNSTEKITYNHVDTAPAAGTNYYRLKQIDFDGAFEYTEGVVLEFEKRTETTFTFYPNPVKELLVINTDQAIDTDNVQIRLYDNVGKLILDHQGMMNKIPFGTYDAGVYYIHINNGQTETIQKIVK